MALPPRTAASPHGVMAALLVVCLTGVGLLTFFGPADFAWAQTAPPAQVTTPPAQPPQSPVPTATPAAANPLAQPATTGAETESLMEAVTRLPLAAALGAALALRPRRKGTPARSTAVVQTQILLSVVGAVIMLVVGASLARAFGIVGAANLIRYRSKIEDPKDAVVMLCSLAVGLASGVGLYRLAVFSTVFLVAALWVIESFEPESVKHFKLSVKKSDQSDAIRKKVEAVLKRHQLEWEIRILADEEVAYDVKVPVDMSTDPISESIAKLDPEGHIALEWDEQKKKGA
jgi:uncharacterized membrane protein YhiD involved in acid resistance